MITLQGDNGGPTQPYIDCIWEVSDKDGVHERYEFRCDTNHECCENICCTPQLQADALARLWMFLFVSVVLVLILVHTFCPRYRRLKDASPALRDAADHLVQNP